MGLPFSSFIGPGIPVILAQNDLRRPASFFVLGLGAGAFKLEPVALLYLARPLAVRPAPFDTGSFSPRHTDNLGLALFFVVAIYTQSPKASNHRRSSSSRSCTGLAGTGLDSSGSIYYPQNNV